MQAQARWLHSKRKEFPMKLVASRRLLGVAAVAFGLLGVASAAQARTDVFLSIGVPGVLVAPAPVLVAPQPVYVQPQPVYVQPQPVYVQPRPVYVQPQPVYYVQEGGWRHRHWRGHRHWD
jgi:hypothetical protein